MSDTNEETKPTLEELKANPDLNNIVTPETPMRRVRFLMVNPTDFLMIFGQGLVFAKRTQIIEGVPEDAKLLSMTVDHVRGGIILVVESETYDEIPVTHKPPVQHVSIKWGVEGATKKKKARK